MSKADGEELSDHEIGGGETFIVEMQAKLEEMFRNSCGNYSMEY